MLVTFFPFIYISSQKAPNLPCIVTLFSYTVSGAEIVKSGVGLVNFIVIFLMASTPCLFTAFISNALSPSFKFLNFAL